MNNKKNRLKVLLDNSIVFAIGNLGSKLITIIMVPLYTYFMSTSEYGTVDLIQTTANLLLPMITLSVFDAVFRFTLDKDNNNTQILSNGFAISIACNIIFLLLLPIFKIVIGDLYLYLYFIVFLQSFQSLFAEYSRGIGDVKTFSVNGILNTFFVAIFNIIFLVFLRCNTIGYLLSIILSSIISNLFLVWRLKIWKKIEFTMIKKKSINELLIYSIPLIPNAFAWWINNASSRYFILYFVGVSANGLFAIASKIPSFLSVLNSIFFQSWQMSAVEEFESSDRDIFYSNVFKLYIEMLFISTSFILFILKPFMLLVVSQAFYSSWKLIPFLLLTVVYSSMSSFLGTNYIASKKTAGIFITTILGAVVNIILNLLLVPILGANGAGISSMFSFFSVFLIRLVDTKKISNMFIDTRHFIINNAFIFAQVYTLFIDNKEISLSTNIILFLIILVNNSQFVLSFFNLIRNKICRK